MSVSGHGQVVRGDELPDANATPPTTAGPASAAARGGRRPGRPAPAARTARAPASAGPPRAEMSCTGSPVIFARVVMGTAMAPNATGAVLATRATTAALIGVKPRAMSITALIATGVPKPASASSSAPKQNAMMTAWIRWSSATVPNERRSTSKCPVVDRHVVDPERGDDDPHDREDPERGALGRRAQRLADRHAVHGHRHDQRHRERDQGGHQAFIQHRAEQDEHGQQRERGNQRGAGRATRLRGRRSAHTWLTDPFVRTSGRCRGRRVPASVDTADRGVEELRRGGTAVSPRTEVAADL